MAKIARAARPFVVAVVALLVLPAVTAGAATKPKGTPIVIGVIGSFTGPQASSSRQAQTVAPAWEKWVNNHGGINGHPVKVVVADDGGDPAKAQAAEKTLVDQENVIAIVVSSDTKVSAFDDDAVSKKVALVSGSANSDRLVHEGGAVPATHRRAQRPEGPGDRSRSSSATPRSSPTCTAPRSPPASRPTRS